MRCYVNEEKKNRLVFRMCDENQLFIMWLDHSIQQQSGKKQTKPI